MEGPLYTFLLFKIVLLKPSFRFLLSNSADVKADLGLACFHML